MVSKEAEMPLYMELSFEKKFIVYSLVWEKYQLLYISYVLEIVLILIYQMSISNRDSGRCAICYIFALSFRVDIEVVKSVYRNFLYILSARKDSANT